MVSSSNQSNHSRANSASAAVTPNPPDQRMRSRILSAAGSLWGQIEASMSGLLFGGAILLVTYTVLVRYLSPGNAPLYTDEITVYMVMWAVLSGCAGVTRNRQHVRTDLLLHIIPSSLQFYCELAANLAGTGFALFLAWYGGLVAYEAWDFGDVSPTNLRFPLWIYYSALPVAAALMAVGHLQVAITLWRTRPKADRSEGRARGSEA